MRVLGSFLLVAVCAALVGAGCGGSSDEGSSDAGSGGGGGGGGAAEESVSIRTPGGKVKVDTGVDVSALDVPVMPGAELTEDSLTRVSTAGVTTVSGTFRTSATIQEIVAFYEGKLEGAGIIEMPDGAMITHDAGDGRTVQIICGTLEDEDVREIVITSTTMPQ